MAQAGYSAEARNQPAQPRCPLTRQRILRAAAQVFTDYGYAAGTTERIAAQADMSISSLTQYFPSRDAIILEFISAHVTAGIALIGTRLSGGLPDSLEAMVRLFVRAAIDNHLDAAQLHRVVFDEAPRTAEAAAVLEQSEASVVALTQTVLDHHPEVHVADTHSAARLVVTTIESLVHRFVVSDAGVEVSAVENEVTAMLTKYLTG